MKKDGARFVLFDLEGERVGEMVMENQHEQWPQGIKGWTFVLDCSVEPHNEPAADGLATLIAYAARVHKKYVLVTQDYLDACADLAGS